MNVRRTPPRMGPSASIEIGVRKDYFVEADDPARRRPFQVWSETWFINLAEIGSTRKTSRPTGTAKIDLRQNRQNRPTRTRGCTTGRLQWRRSAPGRSQPAFPRVGASRKRAPMPALRQWMVPQPSTADSGPQQRRRRSSPRTPGGATGRLQWRYGVSALPLVGVAKLGAPRNRAQVFTNPDCSPEIRERRRRQRLGEPVRRHFGAREEVGGQIPARPVITNHVVGDVDMLGPPRRLGVVDQRGARLVVLSHWHGPAINAVKSVWSSGCVALLWQRSWAVSSHLMCPRRPHDRSSGSPLSEHTHVPQFSVRAGRGAPPRTGHAPPHTSPPPRAHPSRECPLRDQEIKYTQVQNIQRVHR